MRVYLSNDETNNEFPEFLLKIGNGQFPIYKEPYYIELPSTLI